MQILPVKPITHPPPAPLHHGSDTALHKSSTLCFQKPDPSHHPPSLSLRSDFSHFSVLDKPVSSSTYASLLDSCACPNLGKQIHAHTLKTGFRGHEFVETKLLQMYGKFGDLGNAVLVFEKMPQRNLYSWTAVLSVHVGRGLFEEAFALFRELMFEDVGLDFFVFPVVLNICSGLGTVELGRQVHGFVVKYRFVSNVYVGNALIDMYGKCGSLDDAKNVLSTMPERDCVSWNSLATACAANGMVYEALECLERMSDLDNSTPNLVSWSAVIGGFSQNEYDEEAIELLFRMQQTGFKPNARTLASVLPACARLQRLSLGKEIHCYVIRHGYMSNSFVVNGLVDVYRRCGKMGSAFKIFSKFSIKNVVSFNTMIAGYCENGDIYKAENLFERMELRGIKRDLISWNSMMAGYVNNSLYNEALSIFLDLLMEEGIEADSYTLGSSITACADLGSLRLGKSIHSQTIVRGLQSNPFVGGTLIEMYCKCQDLRAAQMAFDEVNEPDTATWNVLISGYAHCDQIENIQDLLQEMKRYGFDPDVYTWNGILAGHVENGHHELALQLFSELYTSNLRPDIYTVGIIIPACARLPTIERGKQVHAHSIRSGYDTDVHICAAIVDMYAKCGSIKHAIQAYNRISNPNLVSQNAMLTAFAMHGHGKEGIDLFQKMLRDDIVPDHVTFLSVLSSCVHAGSVETGQEFLNLMGEYNLEPTLEHYTCMVDLLSRAGKLDEAYKLTEKMPMEPDSVVWGVLLGGCSICGNLELGQIVADKLIELEPNNTGHYIQLANLYAYAGRWNDLARTRQMIKDRGMQKNPGCSWIEDRDEIHVFLAADRSHRRTNEIYGTLNNLSIHMKKVP
ncbi:pentatricopeptide repeat-containing protein At2g13600-like [Malania oleifera]|uniref:pentatricopeptide repeat-containing protein At2g13600-like n=1 Tax=Malania oleifera TaxID=397392 RepID=UPI0025AE08EC|nr:pentatricopeptide repeat-containing protein At2g13600-like [Malania oleifera]